MFGPLNLSVHSLIEPRIVAGIGLFQLHAFYLSLPYTSILRAVSERSASYTMAKEKARKKDKTRSREKKVSDDKVMKKRKEKKEKHKRTPTPSDTSDSSSDEGTADGVSVHVKVLSSLPNFLHRCAEDNPGPILICLQLQSVDMPMVDSAEPQVEDPKVEKKSKKEKSSKKSKKQGEESQNGASANADTATADGGAALFVIDTNPTPVDLDSIPVASKEEAKKDGSNKQRPPSGLNRAERRRIRLIERQRALIKKQMDIPEGSSEKADEVQKELDKWIALLEKKTQMRRMCSLILCPVHSQNPEPLGSGFRVEADEYISQWRRRKSEN